MIEHESDNPLGWVLMNNREVMPLEDTRQHSRGPDCWCQPQVDTEYNMISHNSDDQRELYHDGRRLHH